MTTTMSLQAVLAFWAAHLGCSEAQLAQSTTTSVVRNGPDLASYRGATVVFRPPACVLAVPADWYAPVASRLEQRPPAEVFDVHQPGPPTGVRLLRRRPVGGGRDAGAVESSCCTSGSWPIPAIAAAVMARPWSAR